MKRLLIYIYALVALLLASCTGGRHQQMLAQLEELERQNVADSLMTNDSLALALADFFDRHGTPNEQLRAHYILGRTYADMGEAPAAIEAYLDAATRADTTASDCNYAKLCRVYGQMAKVFYYQNLIENCIEAYHISSKYGLKAHDTIYALNNKAHEIMALGQRQDYDSVITKFDHFYQEIKAFAGIETAAKYCIIPIKSLLERNNWEKAKYYLDICEQYSGYFDSCHNVVKGREVHYYYKGKYYLAVNMLDSAYYYFRKELDNTTDCLNQNMASYGLSVLFSLTHQADSAAKYALYSYEMNDSVYAHMATKEVERAKALFDYSRHQQMALKQAAKARTAHLMLTAAVSLLIILALAFLAYYWRTRARKNQFEKRLLEYQKMLERRQAPSPQTQNDAVAERPNTLLESKLRKALIDRIEKGGSGTVKATDEEWLQMEEEVNRAYPAFNERLAHYLPHLNPVHYRICLGIKFGLEPGQIAVLVSRSKQTVSNARSRMYRKAFGIDGTTDDFDQFIESF